MFNPYNLRYIHPDRGHSGMDIIIQAHYVATLSAFFVFKVQVLTKSESEVISNSHFRTILILRPSLENHSKQFFNLYNLSHIHPDKGHGEMHIIIQAHYVSTSSVSSSKFKSSPKLNRKWYQTLTFARFCYYALVLKIIASNLFNLYNLCYTPTGGMVKCI